MSISIDAVIALLAWKEGDDAVVAHEITGGKNCKMVV